MPISGLILNLKSETESQVLGILGQDSRITTGEFIEPCLPIVTETETIAENKTLWKHLEQLDSVLQVRLVYCDFSDIKEFNTPRKAAKGG